MATSGVSAFSSTWKLVRQLAILHLMQKECICSSFSCWNERFKIEVLTCSGSASEAMAWISPEKDLPEFILQKGHTRGAESSFAGSISLRTSDCFYDLQVLPSCCF